MSELRICDNPGHIGDKLSRIFSTESEGWSSGTLGVRRFNNRTGRLEVKDVAQDSCPECMDRVSRPYQAEIMPTDEGDKPE